MRSNLNEHVRYLIGQSGPELMTPEYGERIDNMLERMSAGELLEWISHALEDAGVAFP
jgi:hypothetical protein